jgi:hypothetical protein
MRTTRQDGDLESFTSFDPDETRLLGAAEERALLRDLAECKQKLAAALAEIKGG